VLRTEQTPGTGWHYLVEPGTPMPDGRLALTGSAMATRLSFFLWNQGPDDALLDAAERGELASAEGVAAQAWRTLRDERATAQLGRFHLEWLGLGGLDGLEKDSRRYPFFTPDTRAALKAETIAFVDTVIRRGDRRLETLLSAPPSRRNRAFGCTASILRRTSCPACRPASTRPSVEVC